VINLKSSLAIIASTKRKIRDLADDLIQECKVCNKGSFKNPFICLGILLFISLFGVSVLGAQSVVKSLSIGDFSFLTAGPIVRFDSKDAFAKPIKNFLRESPEMTLIQGNSIVGVSPPVAVKTQTLGGLLGAVYATEETRDEIIEYIVEPGDTISLIAEKFNISFNTILTTNELNKKSIIRPGQKLIILPISGIVHHVKKGDTIGGITKRYKGEVGEIISFNNLSDEGDIFIGDILVIPNGVMPPPSKVTTTAPVPLGSSYFILPHAAGKITQGLHWYNAIDFGGKCGDMVYAAAGGQVQRVRYGWNGGAGNYITILHPNGVVTMYGHIGSSFVSPGENVSQGDIIAVVGGQPGTPGAGISTGCHVHFGVRGARNPFAR